MNSSRTTVPNNTCSTVFATVGYYAIGVVPFFVFQRMLRCDLLKLSLNLDSLEHLSNKLLLLKKERALAISQYISLSL